MGDFRILAGAMDSPFDYNKKMALQASMLKAWYSTSGKLYERPKYSWPDSFTGWVNYKNFVTGAENTREVISKVAFDALNKKSDSWQNNPEVISSLEDYQFMTPPGGRWWNYAVGQVSGWNKVTHLPTTSTFVPSLGMYAGVKNDTYDESQTVQSLIDSFNATNSVIDAGTDCVGFAQRAMSWKFSSEPVSNNKYAWKYLPDGMAEYNQGHGDDNIWTVLQEDFKRYYPTSTVAEQNAMVAAYNASHLPPKEQATPSWYPIVSDDIISKLASPEPGGATTAAHLEMLRRVVPGDVWVKDSKGDADSVPREHIAIVAYVPPNAMELDAEKLMEQIILIEGEFTNKIQSVIKKLSVGDYNSNDVLIKKEFYPGFALSSGELATGLNCYLWVIRRLK